MKKFFAAALVVSMLTVLLSGCMCQVADTTFQFDGSGTVEAKFGFSEEMVNAMNMRTEMTQNGFSYFHYDGHGYYGDQASESFANADLCRGLRGDRRGEQGRHARHGHAFRCI